MRKSSSSLEIHLFGAPRLLVNGQGVDNLRRKNRALIYYLAAHDQPLTRENLLSFFWPDHQRADAQRILRTMIYDLRKQLGESFCVDDDTLSLAANTVVDAQAFSAVLRSPAFDSSALENALSLYKGDFLEGFSLTDSPQFDDWSASERDRYRLLAMNGFAELAHRQESLRDCPAALRSMQRALAFNPFQEELQRDLMRLFYLNGDRASMIRQYESLRKLLDEELGVPPMPETRSLYDSLINDSFVSPPVESTAESLPTSPMIAQSILPFIGRDAELEMLKSELTSGKLILLEGEPGIGKTRLASELIAIQLRRKPVPLILRGVAYELEQGLPYQPIVDALRNLLASPEWKTLSAKLELSSNWLTELTRLLTEILNQYPELPAPAQPADESRLWEALVQLIRALTHKRTVWLFLDDLQWADAATIGWLGYLIRHLSSNSFVLLATSRTNEGRTDLLKLIHALRREDRLIHLRLSELSESAMHQMANALSPGHQDELSKWLIQNAEGNTFFLTELVRYAYGIGLLKTDGSLDEEIFRTSPIVPATIQNLIESRLLRLSENARDVLHLAAIIGREFDFELVQKVSQLSETDTLDAIEELQTVQLIRPLQGDKYSFDHSLTMQVALQDLSQTRRHLVHRRVAESIESIHQSNLDPVSGLIARHFIDANLPVRAAAYAFRAGEFAAGLAAWVDAIAFYEQALSLETDQSKHASIFLALGNARFHKGDFALSSEAYQTAVQLAHENQNWHQLEDAHIQLSTSLLPQARYAEAIAMAKELRTSGPPELALCAELIWGTALSVESAHPVEAEFHLREAERLLHQQVEYSGQITLTQITYQLAAVVGQQGRSLEAIDLYRKALDMMNRGEGKLDILRNIMLYNNLAYHLHLVRDPAAADTIRAGLKLAQEKGSLSHLPYLYSTSGEIALGDGDPDRAEKYFSDGLALAEQIPVPERIAGLTANLGLVAKQRGESGLARQRLETALNLAEQLGSHHLQVRIRLWLAPLLSPANARSCLNVARVLAEKDGLQGLLNDIRELGNNLNHP
jgi:predicted ATPase/DNA-binding SARP family transcriptional activator